jgi:hypothetical protein
MQKATSPIFIFWQIVKIKPAGLRTGLIDS